MLIDANVLLYAVDDQSPYHDVARDWLERALNGRLRVGLPWQSLGAFLRIATHPRVTATPLTGPEAWALVARWLERDVTWVPPAGRRTADVLGELVRTHHVTGDLMPDAMLAALAIEHGLTVMSADSDFARLPEVRWENPLSAR